MKNLYLFILIGLSSLVNLQGQNKRFKADESPCKIQFTVDPSTPSDWDCHNFVRNTSTGSLSLLWKREDVIVPDMWEPTVCDNVQCYGTNTKASPINNVNEINKNGSMLADVHVYDAGIDGSAYVKLTVFEKEDTNSLITIDYLFNKESVGTSNTKNIRLRMFPNPTSQSFTVEYNSGINRIDLFSVLGSKIKSYQTEPSKSYDISNLEDGLYFVKFITTEGKTLRTLRLQKRAMRP